MQDAFLGLHQHWDKVRDPGRVLAYLRTAVVNGSRSRHRRYLVARRLRPEPLALAQSAEALVLAGEDQRALLAAVDALPRRQREVLALKYFLDLGEREIAEILSISRGTVASTASRALTALARQLREELMTSLEDRLRDAYRTVTDTVREDELPGLDGRRARTRRRRSRFSTFAPLAAAAAVVVAIVASVAVPKWVGSPSPPATPATPSPSAIPAGTPPFVVIMNKPDGRGYLGPLVVVSAATGRVTGTVPEPMPDTTWYDAAPTGSGTTFVLAATPLRGGLCNPSYLYTLTLLASGAPASLKPWTDPVVPANHVDYRQRGRRHPRLRRGPMPQRGSGDRDHPRRQDEDVAGAIR